MKSLAIKILDVFIYKFESKLEQGLYQDYRPTNKNYEQMHKEEINQKFDFTNNPGTTFESALPLIFQDVSESILFNFIFYFV